MAGFSSIFSRPVLTYLKWAAKVQLAKRKALIIGLTGSAGKTSTLASLEALFKETRTLKVSHKANSESGIPLNILGLSPETFSKKEWLKLLASVPVQLITSWPKHDTYIVEMGIDSPIPPKNMSHLLSILKPDIGIFLNVAAVHAQAFDQVVDETNSESRQEAIKKSIAVEKGKLIESLPKTGLAVLNADDPRVIQFRSHTKANVATFGKSSSNTVWFDAVEQSLDGTLIHFHAQEQVATLHLKSYLLPDHFAYSFAAALCVALHLGQSLAEAVEYLQNNFVLPPGRSTLIPGIKGSLLLDSSYNASAQPTIEALQLVHKLKPKQGIALLGDMREIGLLSEQEHRKVADVCLETTKAVFLVGPMMKQYVLPFLQQHNHPVSWYPNALDAAQACERTLKVGDLVLIKGSQNTLFLESATKHLMRHKDKAHTLLCRQTPFWEKQSAQTMKH
jgi:UDP-N-acetylmuramoyl-tripeptide--D-alanyl-D-alanine ligase